MSHPMGGGRGSEVPLIWVTSTPVSHFEGAIADGAIENESIEFDPESAHLWAQQAGLRGVRQYKIEAAHLLVLSSAATPTAWALWFWKDENYQDADIADDGMVSILDFTATADAHVIVGEANVQWYEDHDINAPVLELGIKDETADAQPTPAYRLPRLHIGLQPTGNAKPIYDDGVEEVVVRVALRPLI